MDYRREVDGLRAIAVVPVILFHAGIQTFSGGFVGVDIFFVISGYLITSIILAEKQAGTFTLINFYERRARRILPALFVVMFACLPFAWLWLFPLDLKSFSQSLVAVSGFASNILFWRTSGYFDSPAALKPLLHTWSLAVEEQYYLLFPIFLMLCWRLGKRWIFALLGVIALISLAVAQWGSTAKPAATFYLLPTRAWELFIGAFVAFYLSNKEKPESNNAISEAGGVIGLLLIIYSIFFFDKQTPFPSLYTLVPSIGAAIIILCASQKTIVGKLLSNGLFVGIGLISYSAYLWHQPLFSFAKHRSLEEPSSLFFGALCLLILIISYFTWRYIEKPFRSIDFIDRKKTFLIALIGTIFFSTVGAIGYLNEGFPNRLVFGVDNKALAESQKKISLERFSAIKSDVCHFTNLSKIGIDNFITQWNCKNDNLIKESRKIPLVVAGDSNAADLVVVFKLNGFIPAHISGAGCELVPSRMSVECKKMFEKLRQEVAHDEFYKILALTKLFTKHDLTPDAIEEIVNYWSRFNKKIVLFAGTPRFPKHYQYLTLGLDPKIDLQLDELVISAESKEILKKANVYIVDRNQYFCEINACSYFSKNGNPLISDERGEHLSAEGAKLFGERLLKNDAFLRQIVQ